MGPLRIQQLLIAELSHQINSPLAAIRSALYLASCRTDDPELQKYLELANEQLDQICCSIKEARGLVNAAMASEKYVPEHSAPVSIRRAAA